MLNNTITRHMMPSFTDLEAATFLEKRGYIILELDNLRYQLITSFDDETKLEDRNTAWRNRQTKDGFAACRGFHRLPLCDRRLRW